MQWYLAPWRSFARFSGRARRREFWIFSWVNGMVIVALFINDLPLPQHADDGPVLLSAVFCLAVFIPSISVCIRRLHDTGRSARWLLMAIVPVANLVFLVNLTQDGDPGTNKYGPDPKGLDV
ncbi:MAG: DUF805 domain-containing protein [Gemmatimonadota bacterium]